MPQDIHIRAVAFKEGDAWIAQGIDYDIVAHAGDPSELPHAFMRAVFENACISEHLGRGCLQGIKPAPQRYIEMFEHAQTQLRALDVPPHLPVADVDIRLVSGLHHWMAAPFGVAWPTIRQLIDLFVAMGCELGELPGRIQGPKGASVVRYLYSPMSDDFVSLSDYADDDHVPMSEVANWERRLGVEITKKPADWN